LCHSLQQPGILFSITNNSIFHNNNDYGGLYKLTLQIGFSNHFVYEINFVAGNFNSAA